MALSLEAPMVEYTGPTFCHLTQAIVTVGIIANYAIGPGTMNSL